MPRKTPEEYKKEQNWDYTRSKVWGSVLEEFASDLKAKKDALRDAYQDADKACWKLKDERDEKLYDIFQGKDRHSGILGQIRDTRDQYSEKLQNVRKEAEEKLKKKQEEFGDEWIEAEMEKRVNDLEDEAKKQFPDVKAQIFFEGQDQIAENDNTLYVPVTIDEQKIASDIKKSIDDSEASLKQITNILNEKKKEAENALNEKAKKEKAYNDKAAKEVAEDKDGSHRKELDEAAAALKVAEEKYLAAANDVAALEADQNAAQEYYNRLNATDSSLKKNISSIKNISTDFSEKKEDKESLKNIADNQRTVIGFNKNNSEYYDNLKTAIENYEKFMQENKTLGEGKDAIKGNVEKLNGLLLAVSNCAKEYTDKRGSWFKWTNSGRERLQLAEQAKKMADDKIEQLKTVVQNAEFRDSIIMDARRQYVNYRKDNFRCEVMNLRTKKIARWEIEAERDKKWNDMIAERDAATKKINEEYMKNSYYPIMNEYDQRISELQKKANELFIPYSQVDREYKEATSKRYKYEDEADTVSGEWISKNVTFESFQRKVGEQLLRIIEKKFPERFKNASNGMSHEDLLKSISDISAKMTQSISDTGRYDLKPANAPEKAETKVQVKAVPNPELKNMFGF